MIGYNLDTVHPLSFLFGTPLPVPWRHIQSLGDADQSLGRFRHVTALSQRQLRHSPASVGQHSASASSTGTRHIDVAYSAVTRCSGKGDTALHDAPPLRLAGRISSGAARRYHLVAVTPLDLGAMLTADRT